MDAEQTTLFEPSADTAPAPDRDTGDLPCKARLAAFQRRVIYLARREAWDADELTDLVDEAVAAGCLAEGPANALRASIEAGPPAGHDARWALLRQAGRGFETDE